MKTGRLTIVEKFAIKAMLAEKMGTEDIAQQLDRSSKAVQNYIDVELDQLCETIAKVKISSVEKPQEKSTVTKVVEESEIKKVRSRLLKAGLTELDSNRIITDAIDSAEKNQRQLKNENELFSECIKKMRAGQFMQKKTLGGKDGVAIMTNIASQRLDEAMKNRPKRQVRSDSGRGHIFNPSTGEIE